MDRQMTSFMASGRGAVGEPRARPLLPLVVLAVCLSIFAVRAFTSLRQESATWDETHYFGLGKYLLEHRLEEDAADQERGPEPQDQAHRR